MVRKIAVFVFSGFLLMNICGCLLLAAGAVGGAGTAAWLSGKLTQQFNAPYERVVRATESVLRSYNFEISKVSKEVNVTTFRSHYTDGKEIWIDVRRITKGSSKVEIRVGGVSPDKQACTEILERIKNYL